MTSQHSLIAPSAAHVWSKCTGSVTSQSTVPDRVTPSSQEGTAAHWVLAEVLERRDVKSAPAYEGKTAPNGVVIDRRAVEGVEIAAAEILGQFEGKGAAELLIEQRVHAPLIHPESYGTLDAAMYAPDRKLLMLWDYKHGRREVTPVENLQLINYAAGLVQHYGIDGLTQQSTFAVLKVVQPFCYSSHGPVREWVVRLSDLRAFWNVLSAKAHGVYESPELSAGPWCRDCRAVGKCPAARRASYTVYDTIESHMSLDDMSGDELALEWSTLNDCLELIKARRDSVEEQLKHEISTGGDCGGLTLEVSKGRSSWTIPPQQVAAMFSNLGVDASKQDVLTPNQLLKKADKDVKPFVQELIKSFTERRTSLKLTRKEDSKFSYAFKPRS